MYEPLLLVVRTAGETLLQVSGVAWVQVQLADGGGIGIWPGHAPLLGETEVGALRYADGAGEHSLMLDAGILQITKGEVTIHTTGLVDPESMAKPSDAGADRRRRSRLAEVVVANLPVDDAND